MGMCLTYKKKCGTRVKLFFKILVVNPLIYFKKNSDDPHKLTTLRLLENRGRGISYLKIQPLFNPYIHIKIL